MCCHVNLTLSCENVWLYTACFDFFRASHFFHILIKSHIQMSLTSAEWTPFDYPSQPVPTVGEWLGCVNESQALVAWETSLPLAALQFI